MDQLIINRKLSIGSGGNGLQDLQLHILKDVKFRKIGSQSDNCDRVMITALHNYICCYSVKDLSEYHHVRTMHERSYQCRVRQSVRT